MGGGSGQQARRRVGLGLALVLAAGPLLGLAGPAAATSESPAAPHPPELSKGVRVSMADYTLPDIGLVRDDGKRVALLRELDDGRPVVLNFIYTTCPGICPLMSAVFSQFQERLGSERAKVHMVSISIDPEQDTPARLREYARKFAAGPQWQHYTGSIAGSVALQRAFNAYRGDKMSHDPLTLMRVAPGRPWLRIDGFASGQDLATQFAALAAPAGSPEQPQK
jgi:protein SCO1/2